MSFSTASLCDRYSGNENFHIAEPIFRTYGGIQTFSGEITTIKCFEDNSLISTVLTEPGNGRVLVVDGGGSHRCALLGIDLARKAHENNWQGLIVYGCVRDGLQLAQTPIGILALHTQPLLCHSKNTGDRDVMVTVAGVNFRKDHYVYTDMDGIIVSGALLR